MTKQVKYRILLEFDNAATCLRPLNAPSFTELPKTHNV